MPVPDKSMNISDYLGFTAAFCTTVSFLPQAIKVIKTRDTASLSLAMYIIFTVGVALWLAYGIAKLDIVIITANVVTLVLAFIILCTKIVNELKIAKEYKTAGSAIDAHSEHQVGKTSNPTLS